MLKTNNLLERYAYVRMSAYAHSYESSGVAKANNPYHRLWRGDTAKSGMRAFNNSKSAERIIYGLIDYVLNQCQDARMRLEIVRLVHMDATLRAFAQQDMSKTCNFTQLS